MRAGATRAVGEAAGEVEAARLGRSEDGVGVAVFFASPMTAKVTTEPQHYLTVLNERDIKIVRGSGESMTA